MLYWEIIAVCSEIHTKHVPFVRPVIVIHINPYPANVENMVSS